MLKLLFLWAFHFENFETAASFTIKKMKTFEYY